MGYDVPHLLHEIARELGLTHDWPVVIVGVGNLGHALANYQRFEARGYRVVALVDADPEKLGRTVGGLVIEPLDALPTIARERGVAIGIIATPAHAAQEVADRLVDAGVTVDPQLRPDGGRRAARGVAPQGRPRDRAADPLLLPAAPRRRADRGPGRHREAPGRSCGAPPAIP